MAKMLHLRNFTVDDLDDFLKWATDPEVTKYMTWEPYKSREDALHYLTSRAIPDQWCKAVCLDGKVIGSIHLRTGSGLHRCLADLGYCLAKKYWGHGYMTEAVKLILTAGFEGLDVQRIQALVRPENVGSQRVLEKAGFHRDALLRNYIVVSIDGQDRASDCFLYSALPPLS